MDEFHFASDNGSICLYDGTERLNTYRNLAFCFDIEDGTLLKYGEAESVEKWMHNATIKLKENIDHSMSRKINNLLREANFSSIDEDVQDIADRIAADMTIVQSDNWELETINRFIHNTGYIKRWYDQALETDNPSSSDQSSTFLSP